MRYSPQIFDHVVGCLSSAIEAALNGTSPRTRDTVEDAAVLVQTACDDPALLVTCIDTLCRSVPPRGIMYEERAWVYPCTYTSYIYIFIFRMGFATLSPREAYNPCVCVCVCVCVLFNDTHFPCMPTLRTQVSGEHSSESNRPKISSYSCGKQGTFHERQHPHGSTE